MKLYIAGPMTTLPDRNFPAFHAEAKRLRALGHEVVSPAEIHAVGEPSWSFALRADIRALLECEGIALLPGWEQSRGALLERHVAESCGLAILDAHTILEAL